MALRAEHVQLQKCSTSTSCWLSSAATAKKLPVGDPVKAVWYLQLVATKVCAGKVHILSTSQLCCCKSSEISEYDVDLKLTCACNRDRLNRQRISCKGILDFGEDFDPVCCAWVKVGPNCKGSSDTFGYAHSESERKVTPLSGDSFHSIERYNLMVGTQLGQLWRIPISVTLRKVGDAWSLKMHIHVLNSDDKNSNLVAETTTTSRFKRRDSLGSSSKFITKLCPTKYPHLVDVDNLIGLQKFSLLRIQNSTLLAWCGLVFSVQLLQLQSTRPNWSQRSEIQENVNENEFTGNVECIRLIETRHLNKGLLLSLANRLSSVVCSNNTRCLFLFIGNSSGKVFLVDCSGINKNESRQDMTVKNEPCLIHEFREGGVLDIHELSSAKSKSSKSKSTDAIAVFSTFGKLIVIMNSSEDNSKLKIISRRLTQGVCDDVCVIGGDRIVYCSGGKLHIVDVDLENNGTLKTKRLVSIPGWIIRCCPGVGKLNFKSLCRKGRVTSVTLNSSGVLCKKEERKRRAKLKTTDMHIMNKSEKEVTAAGSKIQSNLEQMLLNMELSSRKEMAINASSLRLDSDIRMLKSMIQLCKAKSTSQIFKCSVRPHLDKNTMVIPSSNTVLGSVPDFDVLNGRGKLEIYISSPNNKLFPWVDECNTRVQSRADYADEDAPPKSDGCKWSLSVEVTEIKEPFSRNQTYMLSVPLNKGNSSKTAFSVTLPIGFNSVSSKSSVNVWLNIHIPDYSRRVGGNEDKFAIKYTGKKRVLEPSPVYLTMLDFLCTVDTNMANNNSQTKVDIAGANCVEAYTRMIAQSRLQRNITHPGGSSGKRPTCSLFVPLNDCFTLEKLRDCFFSDKGNSDSDNMVIDGFKTGWCVTICSHLKQLRAMSKLCTGEEVNIICDTRCGNMGQLGYELKFITNEYATSLALRRHILRKVLLLLNHADPNYFTNLEHSIFYESNSHGNSKRNRVCKLQHQLDETGKKIDILSNTILGFSNDDNLLDQSRFITDLLREIYKSFQTIRN